VCKLDILTIIIILIFNDNNFDGDVNATTVQHNSLYFLNVILMRYCNKNFSNQKLFHVFFNYRIISWKLLHAIVADKPEQRLMKIYRAAFTC